MRKVAVIALMLVLFVMVQPVFPRQEWSVEPETYGGFALMLRAAAGGAAGFFAGGILGAVMGAGFMAVISPSGCPGCQDIGSPIVY
ncbi:MAG: hypothetical protein IJR63_04535 [Synergistaceae bacterium]|nr:hypothetical protein [Synergistaceae bacterium]